MIFLRYITTLLTSLTSYVVDANTPLSTQQCANQPYKIHILSPHTPLMVYIENFVSDSERAELMSIAEPTYTAATTYQSDEAGNVALVVSEFRHSQVAYIPTEPLVDCIRERAASFQGVPANRLEGPQVVKYPLNGYYNTHVDWIGANCVDKYCGSAGDRETSFFVYLDADCEGGETEFNQFPVPSGIDMSLWCEFLDCGDDTRNGYISIDDESTGIGAEGEVQRTLRFKPKAGNAIFWENLDAQKVGITKVAHAGRPVTNGTKIGMNIWTRERQFSKENAKAGFWQSKPDTPSEPKSEL